MLLWRRLWGLAQNDLGYAYAGQSYLAELTQSSVASIRNWTRKLEAAGIVTSKRIGLTKTNHYWVHLDPRREGEINFSDQEAYNIAIQIANLSASKPPSSSDNQGGDSGVVTVEKKPTARADEFGQEADQLMDVARRFCPKPVSRVAIIRWLKSGKRAQEIHDAIRSVTTDVRSAESWIGRHLYPITRTDAANVEQNAPSKFLTN
jgi:hypothetical protein